jgi:Tetratricopeptide repeat
LANAYKKAGEFEQGNTYSQQYYNDAIRILNNTGTFTHQEQIRLDTLAALYIQLGNCIINTAPERALEVYKLGLAAYTTLIQPFEATNAAVTAYANRLAGPIYLQMGKSYLLLNQPDEAKTAFEKADESLATGLNGLYLGHVAVLKGQRDASFTEYKNIDTEDKFALALSELAQLAARIPIKRFDILNISKALRTELLRNHEEWNRDLAAYQYHDFRTKYFVSVMQLDSAYYSAWESNTIAQNWLNNPNRDAAAVDNWLIRQGDATLNEAYYALYLPKSTQKDSILHDIIRKSAFIYEHTAKIYYLNHAVLLTNIGHAYLLLNDRTEAMKFYNQLKAEGLSMLGLDVKEVITKDFRDLKEAGIVFPVDTEKILIGW